MKRLFLTLGLLFSFFMNLAYADNDHKIHLNNVSATSYGFEVMDIHNNPIVMVGFEIKDVDDDGNYVIDIKIDNTSDTYFVYLFTKPYTPQELRRDFRPGIVYSKGFKENSISVCSDVFMDSMPWICIRNGEPHILKIEGNEDRQSFQVELPLYLAKQNKCLCKRHMLINVKRESLLFKVEIQRPDSYFRMKDAVEEMLGSMSGIKYTVCNHRSGKMHHPSLEEQQNRTRASLDSLKALVYDEMNYYRRGSRRYKEFEDLTNRLNRFDLSSIPIVECDIPDRSCSCPAWVTRMSMDQIYHRMEDIYIDIIQGHALKRQVMGEVKSLYTHSGHISGSATARQGIREYYNKICNL